MLFDLFRGVAVINKQERMRARVITKREAEGKYGSAYNSRMGFASDGEMEHWFGRALNDDEMVILTERIAQGLRDTRVDGQEWCIKIDDLVLASKDVYVRDNKYFVDKYKRYDFWKHSACVVCESMLPLLGSKLKGTEVDALGKVLFSNDGEESMIFRGWTLCKELFTETPPSAVSRVKAEDIDRSNSLIMNTITICRGDIKISISKEYNTSEGESIFFVDGEDGEEYRIPKGLVKEPSGVIKYVLNACHVVTGRNVSNAMASILKSKEFNGDYRRITEVIVGKDLDEMLKAVYSIKDFKTEYEEILLDDYIKWNYPSLTKQDLNNITDEQRKIQNLIEVFEVEA